MKAVKSSKQTNHGVFNKLADPLHGILLALIAFVIGGAQNVSADTDFDISGEGEISWVSDGDTARITVADDQKWYVIRSHALEAQANYQRDLKVNQRFQAQDGTVSMLVRIAAIDTAESQHPIKSRNTLAGVKASDYAKKTFHGPVNFQCWTIGYYGRPICSVQTSRGDWGKHMINAGYSKYVTKYGRHPFDHAGYSRAHAITYQ